MCFAHYIKNICEPEHKKKINIHYRARYDRFFKKPNTQSWQDMVKDIRDKSLICLLDIAAEQAKSKYYPMRLHC